jgi:Tol biopolymer transport system component
MAFGREGVLELIAVSTLQTRRLIQQPAWRIPFAWSPDGAHLAVAANEDKGREAKRGRVVVLAVSGAAARTLAQFDRPLAAPPTWSSDGRRLAFIAPREGKGWVYVVTADGETLLPVCEAPHPDSGSIRPVRWRP